MRAAFYKGTRPKFAGVYNRLVRWWDKGAYSHVEIEFSDGQSASSSYSDGGVRFKNIEYSHERWDFIPLDMFDEASARLWMNTNIGKSYDVAGNIGFLFRPFAGAKNKFFCSEAVMSALGFSETWRFSPNTSYIALKRFSEGKK